MKVLRVREATENDLTDILSIFSEAVTHSTTSEYNTQQRNAWTRAGSDPVRWTDKLESQHFLIAGFGQQAAGLGSINGANYLDVLYVHPSFQRLGVAQAIFNELERVWLDSGEPDLLSDVSLTARPFFEKNGFKVIEPRSNFLSGIELVNFRMIKKRL